MNRQTMLHNRTLVIAGLLALTACNQTPPAEPPLAGAAIGGDFTLTGEDGKQVSWEDFDGKYRTVYFGYTYLQRFPGIQKYIVRTLEQVRECGYSETLFGRKTWFPRIGSKNQAERQGSERAAINAPIQGTSADII